MNAVRKFTVLCLMLLIASLTYASSYSNDAFVLVDVSGTMKDSQANTEAKSIIQEILLGEFDYSKWQTRGWIKNDKVNRIPSEKILKHSSYFCIIPFGDIDRVKDYSRYRYDTDDNFKQFFSQSFPKTFKDGLTYLTLAKAYVGSIAYTDKIAKAYVLIYTDGRPESTKEPYDNFNQHIVDDLEAAGSNSFQKIGILRKNGKNKYHYDIEIWEFTSYTTEVIDDGGGKDKPQPPITVSSKSIKITTPTDGKLKDKPHEVDRGQEFTLRWSGGAGSVNVYTKDGNNYKLIPQNKRNEYYTQTISGTTAKLTFSESADYKIEVRGTNGGSDAMFLRVKTRILPILLKLLLVIGLIVGGVYAWNEFIRPDPDPRHNSGEDNGWEENNSSRQTNSHASSGNDDW